MKLVVRARLSRFLKADNRTQLAVEKRQVNRGGKTFEQGFHVNPKDAAAKTPPAPGESLFTKRPMPQMTLTTQDYRFIGNVAKLMGMTIPTREAQSADTLTAMKKRLDEGISKGWKLKFGDINAMSAQLGQIAQRMAAKGGKGVVMKASKMRHWLRLNPKLKKRKKLVVRNGKAYYRDTYTKQEPTQDQSPTVAKSLVSDAMSAEKAKYGKPKKARIKKSKVKVYKAHDYERHLTFENPRPSGNPPLAKSGKYTHPEKRPVRGKHGVHYQTFHVGTAPKEWKLNAINPSDIEEVEYAPGRKAFQMKGNTRMTERKRTAEEILRNHVAAQVYDKVSAALKTVKSSSYNLSREEDWRKMHADQWKALQDALPGLPMTQKEYLQIESRHMNKESGGTTMDIWDDVTDKIVRNMEKRS